jgi:hypothetical protein
LRFAELSLTEESRRWQYRRRAAQAEKTELRGLLLPEEPSLRELDEPCATFRPNRPEGLVPPRQPVLLMRPPRWASQAGTA